MNIIAINGSPRKKHNTALLLQAALDGATEKGATGEMINLYDLNFKGCTSCFACKLIGGKSYGKCAMQDDLTPVLEKIAKADALVMGTPVYFGNTTGEFRSFYERLLFPYFVYDKNYSSLWDRKMPSAIIYTMNIKEEMAHEWNYQKTLGVLASYANRNFGSCEPVFVYDTCQFDDYSKYKCEAFDPVYKKKRKEENFPKEIENAKELGRRLVSA